MHIKPSARRKTPQKARPTLAELQRPDGRPEVYDVPEVPNSEGYACFICKSQGHAARRFHKTGEIFMTSPINTPNGQSNFVCKEHLPENVVIYSPFDDTCRDKSGQNVWKESADEQPSIQ